MPNFAVAGNSGCYTVSGAIDQTGGSGTISGDIEGSIAVVAGPADIAGVVVHRPVEQTWQITGGTVEALIGNTLVFDVDFRGIMEKWPLIRINNTALVIAGAEKGNLTQHGISDMSSGTAIVHLEYHGVICP